MQELLKGIMRQNLVKPMIIDTSYLELIKGMTAEQLEISFLVIYTAYLETNFMPLSRESRPYLYDLFKTTLEEELADEETQKATQE